MRSNEEFIEDIAAFTHKKAFVVEVDQGDEDYPEISYMVCTKKTVDSPIIEHTEYVTPESALAAVERILAGDCCDERCEECQN